MNHYAVIDRHNIVRATWAYPEDAGDRAVQERGESLCAREATVHGAMRWVYVDGPCKVGDELDVDADGCAEVRELS